MLKTILATKNGRSEETPQNDGRDVTANPEGGAKEDSTKKESDYRLEAVNRVLSSEHFRASDRNKRFLKFVVEETVAGRAERIKAFTVAVDVFGRDSDFDASVDPTVRIAAGHLRRSLREYYATHGARDPVQISLPLGTYVPKFIRRESMPRRTMTHLSRIASERRQGLQSGTIGVTMALFAGGAALAYVAYGSLAETAASSDPVVIVDSAQAYAQPPSSTAAQLFTESLRMTLNAQDELRMITLHPQEVVSDALKRVRSSFRADTPLYQLLTAVRADDKTMRVYWHVVDGRSGETYLSDSVIEEVTSGRPELATAVLARKVAASLKGLVTVISGEPETAPRERKAAEPR